MMRISNLKIHNFRSVKDLSICCSPLMVLIGPNNHGKSNILEAIEFALSTGAKPTEDDFFIHRGEENDLWVELEFAELTDQEKTTFKKYIQSNSVVYIRKIATFHGEDNISIQYNGYLEEPNEWWLKTDNIGNLTKRDEINKVPLKDYVPSEGRLSKAIVEKAQIDFISDNREILSFTKSLESGPLLGVKNVAGGVLPEYYPVPAIKELTDETKIKSSTSFGRLVNRAVKEMAERDPRFSDIKERLDKLIGSLNVSSKGENDRPRQLANLENNIEKELEHWGVKIEIEVISPSIERIFELGTNLHIDDGLRTLAEKKGHGLQRAVIFALLKAWARILRQESDEQVTVSRRSSDSLVFSIEEPELYLHPHAQRRLSKAIGEIADTPEHQIFICTHSTYFVDLENYKSICLVQKEDNLIGSEAKQCIQDLFEGEGLKDRKNRFHMTRWINPDRGEMFFAKKIVFAEGETEKSSIPFLAEKLGKYDQDISVIDCGSKYNLPLYVSIANAFRLKYIVVHDEDPLPDPIPADWSEDKRREKRKTYVLNNEIVNIVDNNLGSIEMMSPDFEGISGISSSQGEKKGKALAAVEYFQEMNKEAIPEGLIRLIDNIYGYGAVGDEDDA